MIVKRFFVDTNILAYAYDQTDRQKYEQARAWLQFLWQSRSGRISAHVLSEFFNLVTRKPKFGLSTSEASDVVQSFSDWHPVPTTVDLILAAVEIRGASKFGWWDCLALAGAIAQSSIYFLSEDLQDRQRIAGLTIVNPFQVAPEKL